MANRFLPAGLTLPNFGINPSQYAKAGQNWIAKQWEDALTQGELQRQKFQQGLERKVADAQAIKQQLEKNINNKVNQIKSQAKATIKPQVQGEPIRGIGSIGQPKVNPVIDEALDTLYQGGGNPKIIQGIGTAPGVSPAGQLADTSILGKIRSASLTPSLAGVKALSKRMLPYTAPIADAVYSGLNWNLPGSDWRTRLLDFTGALGNAGATGLGLAGGKALAHPVVGGIIGGAIGTGLSSMNKAKAQQLREGNYSMEDWKRYYDKDAENQIKALYPDDKELQQYYIDRYYGRGIPKGGDSKEATVPNVSLLDIVNNKDNGLTVFGDSIEELENIGKFFNLPSLPKIIQSEGGSKPVIESNNTQGTTLPKINLQGDNEAPEVSEGDFYTNVLNRARELRETEGVTPLQTEPGQPVQQQTNQSPLSAMQQQYINQLQILNNMVIEALKQPQRDPVKDMWIARAGGMVPSQVFGTPKSKMEQLSNAQTALSNQMKLASSLDEAIRKQRYQDMMTGAIQDGEGFNSIESILPLIMADPDNAKTFIQYVAAPYLTEELNVRKDERALNKDLLGRQLSNEGQMEVAKQYGQNARDLANFKFPFEVYLQSLQGRNTAINNLITQGNMNKRFNAGQRYKAIETEYKQQQRNDLMKQANALIKLGDSTGNDSYYQQAYQLMGVAQLIDDGNTTSPGKTTYSKNVVDAYGD